MRRAIRRNNGVVIQFKDTSVKNEGEGGDQARPDTRQKHAGHDDDERIKEVQGTVPTAGLVDHEADEDDISKHLQRGLQPVLLPEREQKNIEQRQAVPEKDGGQEEPPWHGRRTELRHREFNGQQQSQDEDADPNQPNQPITLIKRRLHESPRFQSFKVSKFRSSRFLSRTTTSQINLATLKLL